MKKLITILLAAALFVSCNKSKQDPALMGEWTMTEYEISGLKLLPCQPSTKTFTEEAIIDVVCIGGAVSTFTYKDWTAKRGELRYNSYIEQYEIKGKTLEIRYDAGASWYERK